MIAMSEKIEIQTEKFNILESKQDEEEITIEGTAVPYDTRSRNGAKYTGESIKKAAKTLEGKPLLYNHWEDEVLGKVEKTIPKDDRLEFVAKANKSKERVQDIKNEYISTVSIQAMVDENEDADEKEVLDVQEFLELSATPVPGFGDATINKHNAENKDEDVRVEKFDTLTEDSDEEDTSGEPFAGFDDWDDCKQTMKDKGYSDEEADKICGALQDEYETILKNTEGDNMTDENETEEQDIEDLEDALGWIESNAPDEVVSLIQDALQTEEADDDEDDEDDEEEKADTEETEKQEEPEENKETEEDKEEKLEKLKERIEKLEENKSKEVEESKQPNVGSEKPTSVDSLVEKVKKAAKGGD